MGVVLRSGDRTKRLSEPHCKKQMIGMLVARCVGQTPDLHGVDRSDVQVPENLEMRHLHSLCTSESCLLAPRVRKSPQEESSSWWRQ